MTVYVQSRNDKAGFCTSFAKTIDAEMRRPKEKKKEKKRKTWRSMLSYETCVTGRRCDYGDVLFYSLLDCI